MRVIDRVKIRPQVQVDAQVPLNIPFVKQEQDNWCWAACAEMTINYYGNDLPQQCDFANWLFGQNTCCQDGSTKACDKGASTDQVTSVYTQWGIYSSYVSSQVVFATLQGQISIGCPVEIAWLWRGGGGHVVLLVGCTSDASGQYVYINDPWTGPSLITYAALMNGQGHGVWLATWTGIAEM